MKSFSYIQSLLRVLADGIPRKSSEILQHVAFSKPTMHKYLSILISEWKVIKSWKTPHVTYAIANKDSIPANAWWFVYRDHDFDLDDVRMLKSSFLKYTADGGILEGVQWFIQRCEKRNFDMYEKIEDYRLIYSTIESLRTSCYLLDAGGEFCKHVQEMSLDALYYAWQYKRNEFGRGKLAEQWFYAKQTQHKELLHTVCSAVVDQITCLVKTHHIDALALTPPSIKRELQILNILDEYLAHINLPRIQLVKDYPHGIITPQKSLRKRADRILNARNTIYVYDKYVSTYNHVLLIDDFVGSGSTLNETAKKVKKAWVKKVTWFALVGNLDLSYEVINEM